MPIGGSHDRTDFLPFKAGVAIMALGAMAANPGLQVQIVPVGLSYFHPDRFRSRAVVEFGRAMAVPGELVERFKEGGPAKREASGKLLDVIYDALKTVTLRAPDYDTLMVSQYAYIITVFSPSLGHSSCATSLQDAWTASQLGPSCRVEQALHLGILTLQGRASRATTARQCDEIQPPGSRSRPARSSSVPS
jgi:hypothetical protein